MKVSIVCIADRPDRLPLLFWSLVAQTHTNWELIVLDQSNNPRGVDCMITVIPDNCVGKVRIVRVDRAGDWGQGAKEKAARDYASGALLMFPNDDAYYPPTALAEFVWSAENGADIAICGWLYDLFGYSPMPPSTQEGRVDVGGFAIARRLFLQVGWPDRSQTGDVRMLEAAIKAGGRVGMIRKVLYVKS